MTRIDFYTLEPDSPGDRFILTCRLVERIRAEGLRILIYCPERDQARHLDRLLWTLREDSFLPHGLVEQVDVGLTPILISRDGEPANETQTLINLDLDAPGFVNRFERLCEPLDRDPRILAAGRARFRYYRDQGYRLEHHPIMLKRP